MSKGNEKKPKLAVKEKGQSNYQTGKTSKAEDPAEKTAKKPAKK